MHDNDWLTPRKAGDMEEQQPSPRMTPAGAHGEAEDGQHGRAYAWRRRDRRPKVEFRRRHGAGDALDYGWLTRIQWHPASGTITLLFKPLGVTVTIKGLNLFDLKEKLCEHAIHWVQELGADALEMRAAEREEGQSFAWVESITIEEKEEAEE